LLKVYRLSNNLNVRYFSAGKIFAGLLCIYPVLLSYMVTSQSSSSLDEI